MILSIVATFYQIHVDYFNRKEMFDIQLQMAAGQQMMQKDLSWKEIKHIINDVVSFITSNYIISNNLTRLTYEELSVSGTWLAIINELCIKVDSSLSPEIKRQAYKSISDNYFTKFIKDSIQITLVYQLEKNRNNKYNNRLAEIQKSLQIDVDLSGEKETPKEK